MSDIFDEYAKIAVEQGLIKEAAEAGDKTNQRFDSLSDDDIRSLYGVKPNGEEKHILDQAHPESAFVAPAYDKMNGLVENLFERQDIMAWIATKPNDGKHTQERYVKASQDLTMALLNAAFLLDRTGDIELMKLADSCADRLTKEAIAPLAIAGIAAASAAVIGLVNNFGNMIDKDVGLNSERAISELTDLLTGGDLPGKEEYVNSLISDITYIKGLNDELNGFNIDIDVKGNIDNDISQGKSLLKKYTAGIKELSKRINSVISIIKAQGEGHTWLSEYLNAPGAIIEEGWEFLVGEDTKEAIQSLETLYESLNESIAAMTNLMNAIISKAKAGETKSIEDLLKPNKPDAGSGMKQEESSKAEVSPKEEENEDEEDLTQFMPTLRKEPPKGK